MGEVYLPTARVTPYLEHLDAAFAFELFHAPWNAEALRAAISAVREGGAWVLSNHDFPRLPDRVGRENVRAAAMLLLTLPGMAFVYQGDEIGQGDGPHGESEYDRAGRDPHRHPVQWTADPRTAGFTEGEPWLAPVDPRDRNVAGQENDPASLLRLYRRLIALRPLLGPELEMLDAAPGVVAYSRGEFDVAVNTTGELRTAPSGAALGPHEALIDGGGLVIRSGG